VDEANEVSARRTRAAASGQGGQQGPHEVEVRSPDTGLRHHRWTWCQIGERVYPTRRFLARNWRCPTRGCDGGMINVFPWENPHFAPRQRHPEYPDDPLEGGWYPIL